MERHNSWCFYNLLTALQTVGHTCMLTRPSHSCVQITGTTSHGVWYGANFTVNSGWQLTRHEEFFITQYWFCCDTFPFPQNSLNAHRSIGRRVYQKKQQWFLLHSAHAPPTPSPFLSLSLSNTHTHTHTPVHARIHAHTYSPLCNPSSQSSRESIRVFCCRAYTFSLNISHSHSFTQTHSVLSLHTDTDPNTPRSRKQSNTARWLFLNTQTSPPETRLLRYVKHIAAGLWHSCQSSQYNPLEFHLRHDSNHQTPLQNRTTGSPLHKFIMSH